MTGWRIREDVAWVDRGGRIAALPLSPEGGDPPFLLDGTAAAIWDVLAAASEPAQGATVERIAADVAAAYGLGTDLLLDDLPAFIAELEALGLIERLSSPR